MNVSVRSAASVLVIGMGLSACTTYYQEASAPSVGCEPGDVEITQHFSTRDWIAVCDKKKFRCTGPKGLTTCTPQEK